MIGTIFHVLCNTGFMVGTLNYDKDGVTALGVVYEMAAQLHSEGRQLHEQLDLIYEK